MQRWQKTERTGTPANRRGVDCELQRTSNRIQQCKAYLGLPWGDPNFLDYKDFLDFFTEILRKCIRASAAAMSADRSANPTTLSWAARD
jgi:hypothetical protein